MDTIFSGWVVPVDVTMTTFGDLYRQHAHDVFRFALYLSGNRALAEDITSETFVVCMTSAAPIRTETVKGYLFTIARNLYLKEVRRSAKGAELDDTIADRSVDIERTASDRNLLDATLARLQTLPESDRSALLMRAFEEMSYDEIARALGLSLAAVKVKIHRARRKLAELAAE